MEYKIKGGLTVDFEYIVSTDSLEEAAGMPPVANEFKEIIVILHTGQKIKLKLNGVDMAVKSVMSA